MQQLDEDEAGEQSISVDFHDSSTHHSLHLDNHTHQFTMACLSHHALLLASSTTISLHHFSSWGSNSQWQCVVESGEQVTALALGSSFLAIATDRLFVRLFSLAGLQLRLFCLPAPVVCMSAHADLLLTTFHEFLGLSTAPPIMPATIQSPPPPPQALQATSASRTNWSTCSRACSLPTDCLSLPTQLFPGSGEWWVVVMMVMLVLVKRRRMMLMMMMTMMRKKRMMARWLDRFTREGTLMSVDSAGVVRMLDKHYGSLWTPVANLKELVGGVVWCGVVWCGVVWCGVVWCGVGVVWVWCGCGVVWCGVVWCGVVWVWCGCGVVWCGVLWW